MEDMMQMGIPNMKSRVYSSYQTQNFNTHRIYLSGLLGSPEDYVDELEVIRNMEENDTTILYLNGPGGDADTAIQFIRCIEETEGTVIGSIEGRCFSAYTLIFLACHEFRIADYSSFMVHAYSGGSIGKHNELWTQAQHNKAWFDNLARTVYKVFLTEEEIDRVIDGIDYYFQPDEVMDRCQDLISERRGKFLGNLPEDLISLGDNVVIDKGTYDRVIKHFTEGSEPVNTEESTVDIEISHVSEDIEFLDKVEGLKEEIKNEYPDDADIGCDEKGG